MPESVTRRSSTMEGSLAGSRTRASDARGTVPSWTTWNPRIDAYMEGRYRRFDEPVLLEMEAEGRERGFPIVGRNVGVTIEVLARSVGARRVFELGSGFGYSAYWFARAVGPNGEVHCTDGDADERRGGSGVPRASRLRRSGHVSRG